MKRDAVDKKEVGGYRLFERKQAIPLARPLQTASTADLRMWTLR